MTKIVVDLPGHWGSGGEGIWAIELGNDLYQIDNIPFYAYGLNLGDIVKAISRSPELKPEILEVVQPGGHRTLRIIFENSLTEDRKLSYLNEIKELGVGFERNKSVHVALDIPPEINYQSVCDHLWRLQNKKILEYETCEVRIPGTFTSGEEG